MSAGYQPSSQEGLHSIGIVWPEHSTCMVSSRRDPPGSQKASPSSEGSSSWGFQSCSVSLALCTSDRCFWPAWCPIHCCFWSGFVGVRNQGCPFRLMVVGASLQHAWGKQDGGQSACGLLDQRPKSQAAETEMGVGKLTCAWGHSITHLQTSPGRSSKHAGPERPRSHGPSP